MDRVLTELTQKGAPDNVSDRNIEHGKQPSTIVHAFVSRALTSSRFIHFAAKLFRKNPKENINSTDYKKDR